MKSSLLLSAAVFVAAPASAALQWLGVSESVAEFGTAVPGTWGVDFYFPNNATISVRNYLISMTKIGG